ncbi:hypothetical protein MPB2EB_1604 [Mycoavidus sp. B2-EB]|nr:hypothetical protein MPB2EB_1604 [Mycoavidus sp. B2-EB]
MILAQDILIRLVPMQGAEGARGSKVNPNHVPKPEILHATVPGNLFAYNGNIFI